MYKLYKITSTQTHKIYYGITGRTLKYRWAAHKHASKTSKAAIHCAMRKYGIETFSIHLVWEFDVRENCQFAEQEMIRTSKGMNYNMHSGGTLGFDMRLLSEQRQQEWKEAMSLARQGKQPASGMKHTEENKKLFGEYGKLRWDIYGRYPKEVLDYSFTEAHKIYGISKTHYYRLRQRNNDPL